MLLGVASALKPNMQLGPLILAGLFFIAMLIYSIAYSRRPNLVGCCSFVCITAGVICSSLLVALVHKQNTGKNAAYIFYSIYACFIFLPVLLSFQKVVNKRRCKAKLGIYVNVAKMINYIGFLWAVGTVATGFAVTVSAVLARREEDESEDTATDLELQNYVNTSRKAISVLIHGAWGFIACVILLTVITYDCFKEKSTRRGLLLFNVATTVAAIVLTVTFNVRLDSILANPTPYIALGYLSIFLVDLPNMVAIFTWFYVQGYKKSTRKTRVANNKQEGPANTV